MARPRTVNVAFWLMMLVSVGFLADAIAVIAGAAAYPAQVRKAVEASEVDSRAFELIEPITTVMPYVAATMSTIAALVLAGLAFSVRAGSFAGRVVTWVAIGLALVCNVCGAPAGTPGISGAAYVTAYSRDSSGTHTFAQRLPEAYPPLYRYLSLALAILAIVALVVVVVLLAQRSSNAYFRPPRQLVAPWPAQQFPAQQFPAQQPPADSQAPSADAEAERLAILERQRQRGELDDGS